MRTKKNKGLYNAITALILVIASVVLTLIVVSYTFGLINVFTSTPVIHQVFAYIAHGTLYVTVANSGSANGEIIGVVIEGGGSVTSIPINVTITAGSMETINISNIFLSRLMPGEDITFYLITNTGTEIVGVATVLS